MAAPAPGGGRFADRVAVLIDLLIHIDGMREQHPALLEAGRPVLTLMRAQIRDLDQAIAGLARNA